jgi:hypothetical protein
MTRSRPLVLASLDGAKLLNYLEGVVTLATILGFFGYAGAVSYAAWTKDDSIKPVEIGTHTFFLSGALLVIGALLLLTVQG